MRSKPVFALVVAGLLASGAAQAQPRLYETGPAEDASFVRFVSLLPDTLEVGAAGDGHLRLTPADASTRWQAVRANTPLTARLGHGDHHEEITLTVQPSEFVTVVGLEDGESWSVGIGRESPEDFSAFRVSLGLLNLDPACAPAGLRLADGEIDIVTEVDHGQIRRRQINPVALDVQLTCDGQPTGEAVALGNLRAGDRWTILAHPTGHGPALTPVLDRMP